MKEYSNVQISRNWSRYCDSIFNISYQCHDVKQDVTFSLKLNYL